MKPLHLVYLVATAAIPFSQPSSLLAQGTLTPPGAPAPTMKRLDEIEPRINLQAVPAPAGVDTTNATYHFVINQPGSYYLSDNLAVTKPSGIQINAEDVTLDLNGFRISRGGGTGGDGIQIPVTSHRFSLRNGSIRGFAYGINCLNLTNGAREAKFRDLKVSGCTTVAIMAGPGAALESCGVHDNTGLHGINCGAACTLTNCIAYGNTVVFALASGVGATLTNCTASGNTCTYGILADVGSTISHCSAMLNTSAESYSSGIAVSTGCSITASTARSNVSSAGTFTDATGIGFDIGVGSTIQGCTASNNRGDGIRLSTSTLARGNNSYFNGSSGDGAGIHATSSANRIEGNSVNNNDRGIDVDAAGNMIVSNSAKQNTTNYDIAANNVFGSIVDRTVISSAAVSGNSAASSAGTVDPWANISY